MDTWAPRFGRVLPLKVVCRSFAFSYFWALLRLCVCIAICDPAKHILHSSPVGSNALQAATDSHTSQQTRQPRGLHFDDARWLSLLRFAVRPERMCNRNIWTNCPKSPTGNEGSPKKGSFQTGSARFTHGSSVSWSQKHLVVDCAGPAFHHNSAK